MKLGNPFGHRHALDTRYRFKRAFDCAIGEWDSVKVQVVKLKRFDFENLIGIHGLDNGVWF